MLVAGKKEHNATSLEVTYDMRSGKDMLVATYWRDSIHGAEVLAKNWVDIEIDRDDACQIIRNLAAAFGLTVGFGHMPVQ